MADRTANSEKFARRRSVCLSVGRTRRRGRVMVMAAALCLLTATGQAQSPTIQVSGNTFPLTLLGQNTSQSVTLTVNPFYPDAITITGVQTDPASTEYAVTSASGCTGGGSFAPGANCSVTVQFTPALPGQATSPVPLSHPGTLAVTYNDQTLSATVTVYLPLTGTAGGPHGVYVPGVISLLAGNDTSPTTGYSGDGGPAAQAVFSNPQAMAIDGLGNIFIADTGNNAVRVIYEGGAVVANLIQLENSGTTPVAGNIYIIAGNGTSGGGTDNEPATQSNLSGPQGVAVDAAGNVYIADTGNNAVRVIYMGDLAQAPLGAVLSSFYSGNFPTQGNIYTVAGTLNGSNFGTDSHACTNWANMATTGGTPGNCWNGDQNDANQAQLWGPTGIAVDDYGDLLIADTQNGAIRAVYMGATPASVLTPVQILTNDFGYGGGNQGFIYTVAGNPNLQPVTGNGDGGLATGAQNGFSSTATLTLPESVTLDSAGDLYIADNGDQAVRFVNATNLGYISTVTSGSSAVSVAVDASDDADFVVSGACQVTQYAIGASSAGAATTFTLAGNGTCGPAGGVSGDNGAATSAELDNPTSLAVDRAGNLYILEADAVRFVDGTQSAITFGSQQILVQSAAQSVLLLNLDINNPANPGTVYAGATLLTGISPYLSIASPFVSVTYNDALTPLDCTTLSGSPIDPGLSCGISIAFNPPSDGPFAATANFSDSSYTASTGQFSAQQPIHLSGTGTGVAPTVTLTPNLGIGNVQVGGAGMGNLTLTNQSTTAPVSIYSIQIGSPFQAGTGGTCTVGTATLAANSSCTIAVELSPTVLGLQSANVTVTDNSSTGGGTQTATVSGTGILSSAGVTLTSALNFGPQVVGVAGTTQNLVLTNTSTTIPVYVYNIQFNQISPSGAAFAFLETTTTCPFNTSPSPGAYLGPGQNCTVTMLFNPANTTPQTGSATITDSSGTGSGNQTAQLTGTGVVPQAQLSSGGQPIPSNGFNFGAIAPGATSNATTITISNTGSGTLTFCSTTIPTGTHVPICFNSLTDIATGPFSITGNEADLFTVSSTTCGATLATNSSCTVSVVFSPLMPGSYSATLNIYDDSGGAGLRDTYATQTVAFGGSSAVPVGLASLTIGNNVFPSTPVGQTTTQTVTLTLGTAGLAFQSIAIPASHTEYTVGSIIGCTVNGSTVNGPGSVCQIQVNFTPAEAGNGSSAANERRAPLVVTTTENGGTPYVFALTGTGLAPVAALTPGIISIYVGTGGGTCTGVSGEDGLLASEAFTGYLDGMALDPGGNLYVADSLNFVIWRVDASNVIHLFAGNPGSYGCGGYDQVISGNGTPAVGANVEEGGPMAVDARGGLYIGNNEDNGLSSIRYVDPASSIITSVVGNPGVDGTQGDGWMANTHFYAGSIIQATVSGTAYLFSVNIGGTTGPSLPVFPATLNLTVNDGTVQWANMGRVSGNSQGLTGGVGCPAQTDTYGNGCTGTNAGLLEVQGLALDSSGDLFFSDWNPSGLILTGNGGSKTDNHATVRTMNASTGIVTVIAGNGTAGHAGDGLLATNSSVEVSPGALAFDSQGNLYIVESQYVRRIDATTHVITTVAGNGSGHAYGFQTCEPIAGDGGPATSAGFTGLTGIAFDAADNMYLVDGGTCAVRRIDAGTQTITTISGQGSYWGDNTGDLGSYEQGNGYGGAQFASLKSPEQIGVDGQGNVYIMEEANGVREINVSESVMDYNGIYNNVVQPIDSASAPLTTTVLNAGNSGRLAFTDSFLASPWGINSANFTRDVTNPTGVSDCYDTFNIAPGYECPVNIDFTPLVSGALTGDDIVTDNSQNQTAAAQTIQLYGTASGTPPEVTLLPFLLAFTTTQGTTSAAQNLTLTNTGSTPVTINSIGITPSGSAFAQTNNCPSVLTGNSNCTIMVTFSPPIVNSGNGVTYIAPDILSAQVVVTDTATNSPQISNLIGTGTLATQPSPLNLNVNETVKVSDAPVASPTILLTVNETVHASDTDNLVAALIANLVVNETIHVSDTSGSGLLASTLLNVAESIHVSDQPDLISSQVLAVNETIHVSDAPNVVAQGIVPTINWPQPSPIIYGTPLSATQLDATASVAGNYVYSPPAGTVLTAGPQTLQVAFTPTNQADYTNAADSTSLTVNQEPLTITANNTSRAYGAANPAFTGNISGTVNGDSLAESFATSATATSAPGSYGITPSVTGTNLSSYQVNAVAGSLTVTKAATNTVLTPSSTTDPVGTPVTLTAQVSSSTIGTPSGSVTFYSGTTNLGSVGLTSGTAQLVASSLPGGTDSLTAVYSGDPDFLGSTSVVLVESVSDFTLGLSSESLVVLPGGEGSFTLTVTPAGGAFGLPITFTVSGLPPGATATFTPPSVTPGSSPATVTVTIQIPGLAASKGSLWRPGTAAGVALGLLLPFLGIRRIRRAGSQFRRLALIAILALSAAAGLAGCTGGGFFTQPPSTTPVTITATSGSTVHSTTFQLTVQ